MAKPLDRTRKSRIRLIHLLPNLLTITAICAGLTAIRFGYEANFETAVGLILVACILDALDGRLARMLNQATALGARFNVNALQEAPEMQLSYFVGVPSPAGAILVLLPMVISFATTKAPLTPPAVVAFYICIVGFLMFSRIRTYSFKNLAIDRANTKFFLLTGAILVAALLTYFWITLTVLTLGYIGALIWGFWVAEKPKRPSS